MEVLTKNSLINALHLIKAHEAIIEQQKALIHQLGVDHKTEIDNLTSQINKLNINHKAENEKNQLTILDLRTQVEKLQPSYDILNDPELIKSFEAIQPPKSIVQEPQKLVEIIKSESLSALETKSKDSTEEIVKTTIFLNPPKQSWFSQFKAEWNILWQEIKLAWNKFRHSI
jgi:hypothetical protein